MERLTADLEHIQPQAMAVEGDAVAIEATQPQMGEGIAADWFDPAVRDYQEGAVETAATESVSLEEQPGFLSRMGARAGEAVRKITPRKMTAGLAAAAILLGGNELAKADTTERADGPNAQASAARKAKPMKPVQFMNSIRGIERRIFMSPTMGGGTDMNYKKGVLKSNKLIMNGKCNPKNPRLPLTRTYIDSSTELTSVFCYKNYKDTDPHPGGLNFDYRRPLNNLADKAASSKGISPDQTGEPKKIVATKRKATVT
ncbi:hypothetical protein KC963_00005, partial [Candidatus Saccharibacteria bacterium]|nr:hypothetical protein [Candidatus Saccharibacteria bacterium]